MFVNNTPLVLVILDGWGIASPTRGNAISTASTPVMDNLSRHYPTMTLHASGEMVGLPWSEMGNSEVGHLTLGAGKVIFQSLPLINRSISNGTFFENPSFLKACTHVKQHHSTLHLLGLLSNGGIHSYIDHLYALLELCKKEKIAKVFIHIILDGRDTPTKAGIHLLEQLEDHVASLGVGKIVSMCGRYYAMDRDNRWDRVEKAYMAIVEATALQKYSSALEALEASYEKNIYDEEFVPTLIGENVEKQKVNDNDALVFFNFRPDRARQLTKAIILPGFDRFHRTRELKNLFFVTMTEYDKDLPVEIAFTQEKVVTPLAKVISDAGLRQIHIAETEKYAHVSYFFNGRFEDPFPLEERILIPSPTVASYDEKPAMSAVEITERVVQEIASGTFPFTLVNFANADMIGHTGKMDAVIAAIEVLDKMIGRITQTVLAMNGTVVITADHGNAEEMLDVHSGEFLKEHTTNPVPFILVNDQWKISKPSTHLDLSTMLPKGVLADVAPTILKIMGLPVPPEMTGVPLI